MQKLRLSRCDAAKRKLLYCGIDVKTYKAIAAVIDSLAPRAGRNIAWMRSAELAGWMNQSARSGKAYLRILKSLDVFEVRHVTSAELDAYCLERYGFQPGIGANSTSLFVVNRQHPVWDCRRTIPQAAVDEMSRAVEEIRLKRRSKKT